MLLIAVAACGRIDFDAIDDATAGDAITAVPIVQQVPCGASIFLDTGGALIQDGFTWVHEPAMDWLIALEHVTETDHPVRRYAVESPGPGVVRIRDMGVMATTEHAHSMIAEPVTAGYVMSYTEYYGGTASAMLVTPDMVVTSTHPLGAWVAGGAGSTWFGRAGGGGLAAIGVVSSELHVRAVADDATPSSGFTVLAPVPDGPGLPTLAALDVGLAAVWQSATSGHCSVAMLRADLSIARGPVTLPVAACTDPQIAWLPGSRQIMVAAIDANAGTLYAASWDDTLAPILAPMMIASSAKAPRIATDATGLWITWADGSTPPSMRAAHLDPSGSISAQLGPLGMIDETVPHYQEIQRVAGSLVVLWMDVAQNRSLAATRLCP